MHLCNHCCSGKQLRSICVECVFAAFSIQHAMCMHHIVICGLSVTTVSFYCQILEKYSDIKFHENPSSWSQVVPCRWRDGQTGMMKLVVTFCNFANVPKDQCVAVMSVISSYWGLHLQNKPSTVPWCRNSMLQHTHLFQ